MAAQDTRLLTQILSTQKALLEIFSEERKEKKKGEDKKEGALKQEKSQGSFKDVVDQLKNLNETSKKQLSVLERIDKKLVGGAGTSGSSIKIDQGVGEKVSSLGMGMVSLAKGLVALVGGLIFTILLVPLAPAIALGGVVIHLAIKGYTKIFENISDKKQSAAIKAGSENLLAMGKAIKAFSLSLALSSLALVPLAPILALGYLTMNLLVKGYSMMLEEIGSPKRRKNIQEGSSSLMMMAKGIALFTLAIAVSSLALMAIGLADIGKVALVMVGFAGLFFLLGLPALNKKIKDGAQAAAWMGIGMASIALGIAAISLSIQFAGTVLGTAAILGGIAAVGIIAASGVAFYVIGMFSRQIIQGSLAVAAIGLGLAVFGLGLGVYLTQIANVMGMGTGGIIGGTKLPGFWESIGGMLVGMGIIAVGASALVLYGAIFFIAGQAELGIPEAIGFGALAFAATGLGLFFFGLGLDTYLKVIARNSGTSNAAGEMKISAESFTAGFVTNTSALGMLLGVGGIMALAGVASPFILAGAAAMAMAGEAIESLGIGIRKFVDVVPPGTKIGKELKDNLVAIRDAMLAFVDGENTEGGVLGALKGIASGIVTRGKLEGALTNAILIGPALSSIAQGIGSWADIQNIPRVKGYDKYGQPIYDEGKTADLDAALKNLTKYMPDIIKPFIDLSKQADLSNVSILSVVTGLDMGDSDFYRGVQAAAGIGAALTSTAAGVGAWADIQNIPRIKGYDKYGQPIYDDAATADLKTAIDNITTYMPDILKPFIKLSKQADLSNVSVLSVITGLDLGDSDFYRGVKAATEIGTVLTSTAAGVGAWANIQNIPRIKGYDKHGQPIYDEGKTADLKTALDNITMYMPRILRPFINLSMQAELSNTSLLSIVTGLDLGDSDFYRGVKAATGIGQVLTSVAQGVGAWARLNNIPSIKGFDKQGQPIFDESKTADITTAISNMNKVLSVGGEYSILRPFMALAAQIGVSELGNKSLMGFVFGTDIGDLAGTKSDNPFLQGIQAASQLGTILSSIANGISVYANINAIPEVIGVDKNGRLKYSGKFTNATQSLQNVKKVLEGALKIFSELDQDAVEKVGDLANNLQPFTTFMSKFLNNNPERFTKNLKDSFLAIKDFSTVIKGDPKRKTFLETFVDQMERLAKVSNPFTVFVRSFGKMATDLKVFAENFKIMDKDSIEAFKIWTDSIKVLSTTNPASFAANIETANKAINAAYSSNDGNADTKNVSNLAAKTGEQKVAAVKDAIAQKPAGAAAPAPAFKIDYDALGNAVATALSTKKLNVWIVGEDVGNRTSAKRGGKGP